MSQLSLDLTLEPLEDPSLLLLPRLHFEGEMSTEGTSTPPGTIYATAIECIHRGHATVYRATMVLSEGEDPISVVLKTNILRPERGQDLLDEARIYTKDAKILQGHAIPQFYGAFQGVVEEDLMTCLVLEDCGEPIEAMFHELDRDLAVDIMRRILFLHDIGLVHNDLTEDNILINEEGRVFLIDLECAAPHVCKRADDVLVGSKQPRMHEFECDEIYETARMMRLWTRTYVGLWGSCVPRSVVQTITAESLITMAPARLRETEEQREQLLDHARRVADEQRQFQYPTGQSCLKFNDSGTSA
ncbi:hypothetical protein PLICRDRAFT_48513 [Plicaturopsis crispa FD-325 SS-3]|nr:hypothetical protein PLICRDRAFT_48513 [Plicaturopsis crispa FD-325 SS-3]